MSPDAPVAAPWYVEAFGPLYRELYAHRDVAEGERDAVALLDLLSLPRGAPVLDLGCGSGRHLAPLRAREIRAVGLDLSAALLAEARGLPVLRADMRRIPLTASCCDAVLSLFTGFGYFDDADNARVLRECARVLRPGGRLLLDLFRPDFLRRRLVAEERRDFRSARLSAARTVVQTRAFRGTRLEKTVTVLDIAGGELTRYRESVRAYDDDEIATLLRGAGFARIRHLADLAGAPNTSDAPRRITVAERSP